MKVPWWQVDMGISSQEAVSEVAKSKSYSMGKYCATLEENVAQLLKTNAAIGVTSGSDALLISLLALGIKAGDKVLVQDRSWIAAANAVAIIGAKPVFVDVETTRPTLCLKDLKSKYDKDSKALIVVHMNGRHGDFLNVVQFCLENKLPILEDAAQALGSRIKNKYLGTFGKIGCFSLSIAKIVGSGQGGFCVSDDAELLKRMKMMRLHGTTDTFAAEWNSIGFNFRLTDFHASIAINQLKFLENRIVRAAEIQARYLENLESLTEFRIIPVDFAQGEVGPYVEALVSKDRNALVEYLQRFNIDVRPFYPQISSALYLSGLGTTPNATRFATNGLYLPSGPEITDIQVDFVCSTIQNYYQKYRED
jgi:dTDP-4-amino-4,6-dideoxygalactose transaminase